MNDRSVLDQLTQAAASQQFTSVDPAQALRRGVRARRLRTTSKALSVTAAVTIAGVLTSIQVTGPGTQSPSGAFEDPGDRVALVAAGGPADGYPDLVVRASGRAWVSIEGFGWPLRGMDPVSDEQGAVTFPEISKADAESMCLPMLRQAAPDVPDASWRHSGSWIDDFPSRAGLVASYGADHDGRHYAAQCTLPGDYSPEQRPDLSQVPAPSSAAAILRQCSYQGHLDFTAWQVGAADKAADTLSAALVSPEGYLARCVLSSDERQRVTQLSSTPVPRVSIPTSMVYGGEGTGVLTLVGAVGDGGRRLKISTAGSTHTVSVIDGVYAAAVSVPGPVPDEDTVVTVLDGEGSEVAVFRVVSDHPPVGTLVPTLCFTSLETGDDGC